jgi:hypothetical protein
LNARWSSCSPHPLPNSPKSLVSTAIVGLVGFVLHSVADLNRPTRAVIDRFIFGAPAFAPLLFADLAVLGAIALWATANAARPASKSAS